MKNNVLKGGLPSDKKHATTLGVFLGGFGSCENFQLSEILWILFSLGAIVAKRKQTSISKLSYRFATRVLQFKNLYQNMLKESCLLI